MSEVEFTVDEVLLLLRYMPKSHESAAADIIDQLRQQLEAAQGELKEFQNLYLLLNPSAVELPDAGTFELNLKRVLDDLSVSQSIIKKAQEQKAIAKVINTPMTGTAIDMYCIDTPPQGETLLYAHPPIPADHSEHKWISVEEKWPDPEQGNKIIAYGNGYVFECEFDEGFWCNICGDQFTHWMPYFTPQSEVKQSC